MLAPLQGKSFLPFPQRGFWGRSIRSGSNDKEAEPAHLAFTSSLKVYEPMGAYTDETTMPVDPPYFAQCEVGRCGGGGNFACESGYEGALCSVCGTGRFPFIDSCYT